MAITDTWYDTNKTVIVTTFGEHFTWEEHEAHLQHMWSMLDEVDHKVMGVLNYERLAEAPLHSLAHLPNCAGMLKHPNLEGYVVCGLSTRMGHALVDIFRRIYGRTYIESTLHDALNSLN
ncbi:MAG: hypothetical protein GYB64_13795 [Chloroflexi bacterium]|nr:hypothetical protein [Chloroflexota bacterium]